MLPFEFATRNEAFLRLVWSRAAVKRQRPRRLIEAHLTCAPGFVRHILEAGFCEHSHRISARYGMAKIQELPSGHVLYALSGTEGSR